MDRYGYKVTYRIKQEDKQDYLEIKDFITNELGSDLCFIQWNLLKAFFAGMKNTPDSKGDIELKLLRQHIQLNIGCTINYNRLKARRLPPSQPKLELDKNRFFPLLLEEWGTMSQKNKDFWCARLLEAGIDTHPLISTRGKPKSIKQKLNKLWGIVQQLLAKGFKLGS